jgi:V8-like Glu-specific endopeptidase
MRHALCLLAGAGLTLVSAAPSAGQQGTDATTVIRNTGEARAASPFDSRQGRLEAKPLDWDVTRGKPVKAPPAVEAEAARPRAARPGSSPGGAPNPKANEDAEKAYPQEWDGLRKIQDSPEGAPKTDFGVDFGSQDVFTQYCENCSAVVRSQPQVSIGKLFSSAGTCSASVISGNDIIVTAAHCCYNRSTSQWVGGWRFAPAYRDGFAPYGTFDWGSARVLNTWISNGDRQSDVCLIGLQKDAQGRGVTYYTGWLGRSWDWSSTQVHHAVGYPGNIGAGSKQELCVSESFSPSGGCGGADVLNTGCSMTYGASGGPWVRHYRNGSWVNSVVSGYDSASCTGSFGSTFNGPRFTSANILTLCNAHGC